MNSVLQALALPPESIVNMRVAKKILAEQAGFASGDRRSLQDGIESCLWIAALKPENIAVPAFKDDQREYLEISVLSLVLRSGAKAVHRIQELVHRAIPYPVLLITQTDAGVVLSVGHKRASLGEKNTVVLESMVQAQAESTALLSAMAVSNQPRKNLFVFYQGWLACIQAAKVADISGQYAPALTVKGQEEQGAALEEYERLEAEMVCLSAQARKEKQVAKLVALNERITRLRQEKRACAKSLRMLQ
jgi:hypothetical protein